MTVVGRRIIGNKKKTRAVVEKGVSRLRGIFRTLAAWEIIA